MRRARDLSVFTFSIFFLRSKPESTLNTSLSASQPVTSGRGDTLAGITTNAAFAPPLRMGRQSHPPADPDRRLWPFGRHISIVFSLTQLTDVVLGWKKEAGNSRGVLQEPCQVHHWGRLVDARWNRCKRMIRVQDKIRCASRVLLPTCNVCEI